jgi:hypothetical protein
VGSPAGRIRPLRRRPYERLAGELKARNATLPLSGDDL